MGWTIDLRSTTFPSGRSLSLTLGWSLRRLRNGAQSWDVLKGFEGMDMSCQEITWEVRYRYYNFLYYNMYTAHIGIFIIYLNLSQTIYGPWFWHTPSYNLLCAHFIGFWMREIYDEAVHLFNSHVTEYDIISVWHWVNGWFTYGLYKVDGWHYATSY